MIRKARITRDVADNGVVVEEAKSIKKLKGQRKIAKIRPHKKLDLSAVGTDKELIKYVESQLTKKEIQQFEKRQLKVFEVYREQKLNKIIEYFDDFNPKEMALPIFTGVESDQVSWLLMRFKPKTLVKLQRFLRLPHLPHYTDLILIYRKNPNLVTNDIYNKMVDLYEKQRMTMESKFDLRMTKYYNKHVNTGKFIGKGDVITIYVYNGKTLHYEEYKTTVVKKTKLPNGKYKWTVTYVEDDNVKNKWNIEFATAFGNETLVGRTKGRKDEISPFSVVAVKLF